MTLAAARGTDLLITVDNGISSLSGVAAAKAAVEAPPHASLRQVALGSLLSEILESMA